MADAVEDNGGAVHPREETETPNGETDRVATVATATDIAGRTPDPSKGEHDSVSDEGVKDPEVLETPKDGETDRVATATDIASRTLPSKVEHDSFNDGAEASEELEAPNGETDRVATATDIASRTPVPSKAEHRGDTEESQPSSDEVSRNEDGTTHDDELLRGWRSSTLKDEGDSAPIDYSQLDESETPYEHGFLPGDHIIRWDMLPILWPIQIHGIVLNVSDDKSEVTICDFGITSVKNDETSGEVQRESTNERGVAEKLLDEQNANFIEALQDGSGSKGGDVNSESGEPKNKRQRLNVIILTKWSDLRKWSKVNYEAGLLSSKGGGKVSKSLKDFGQKTGKWFSSVTKSLRNEGDSQPQETHVTTVKRKFRSVRHDVDEKTGRCKHHPLIQLSCFNEDGELVTVRKKCPECIREDCPAMMGDASDNNESSPSAVHPSGDGAMSSHAEKFADQTETKTDIGEDDTPRANSESDDDGRPKSLAEMVSEANRVDNRSERKVIVKTVPSPSPSPERKGKSWRGGHWIKSVSGLFASKNDNETGIPISRSTSSDTEETDAKFSQQLQDPEETSDPNKLPRSDPAILVLARTRFILKHGEKVLPPYHIVNSNSECIAVWCKTGRWSTLQAQVFLHSTAIGHAKSSFVLTAGIAATQPWLIPVFAIGGMAAVGAPWAILKVASDKWHESTETLNDLFWAEAEPEVFVDCILKWGIGFAGDDATRVTDTVGKTSIDDKDHSTSPETSGET